MITTATGIRLNCRKSYVGKHRITISTCSTIGTFIQLGFKTNHFTHVMIDEAGQLLEPMSMIPIMFINKDAGQVILAGDPMQLGPVVLSRSARDRDLDKSFLMRILERFPYLRDNERFTKGYDSRLITKLIYNYRSVPSIVQVFNELFYNAELIPVLSEENPFLDRVRHILPGYDKQTSESQTTNKNNCAAFFYAINGTNQQKPDSPSWFNAREASSVFMFVLKLFRLNVNKNEIGIITPYQQQVRTIRKLFEEADEEPPKIGSVEEFQGQERSIILLSTVRTTGAMMREEQKHMLGFINSPKRLNVSISRPKFVLVLFGNPNLLKNDSNWYHYIKYCINNKTYE